MRLRLGPIPQPLDFTAEGGWKPIREPGPVLMQFMALPVGIGAAALLAVCWFYVFARNPAALLSMTLGPLALLLSFPGIVIVHEVLHAAVHPRWGRSLDTIIGFWPSRVLFYAHFEGALSRNRFLAVFAAPLIGISVLPLVLAALLPLPPGPVLAFAGWCSTFNALLACGDLLGLGLIAFQVPAGAEVRNHGWRTYWRFPRESGDG